MKYFEPMDCVIGELPISKKATLILLQSLNVLIAREDFDGAMNLVNTAISIEKERLYIEATYVTNGAKKESLTKEEEAEIESALLS